MIDKNEFDVTWLFETQALKIAPANKPFWYTSGLIGPYYINAHFLCGGEEKAQEILKLIDTEQDQRNTFPAKILTELTKVYETYEIYKETINAFVKVAQEEIDVAKISYVSGGQRRDWFYAPVVAALLEKPCIYIYNDMSMNDAEGVLLTDLNGASVLNVADLLTIGSSYTKKWVPALKDVNANLAWSLNVVDRMQGGIENLTEAGVGFCKSLFSINEEMFQRALARDYISQEQADMVIAFVKDPHKSMRDFLLKHPEFLEEAQNSSDEKTKKRAGILLGEDLYQLHSE